MAWYNDATGDWDLDEEEQWLWEQKGVHPVYDFDDEDEDEDEDNEDEEECKLI